MAKKLKKFLHLNTKSGVVQTIEGEYMTCHSRQPVVEIWLRNEDTVQELIGVIHLQPGDTMTKED